MSTIFHGYRRLTQKYRNGWAHLDEREFIGVFKMLSISPGCYDADYGESMTQYVTIQAPKGATKKDVADAVADEFLQGCQHEHDCCGCWFGGSYTHTLRHIKRREWTCKLGYSRNL